jgi:tRNA/tmRNA/rRNA uracil-C5-methylase (TrmA/RlmC/RlmD family)
VIVTVGPPAAGGACVGRLPDGRVVFVRHALPGETVRIEVTSDGARFVRADAVEVLEASADRVAPPCSYAGPGGCGGCDWQHATAGAQLRLKTAVVAEQLRRVGGWEWTGQVEAVEPRWGWRTRSQWAQGLGFHAHRSDRVVPVDACLIAAEPTPPGPGGSVVEVAVVGGQRCVTVDGVGRGGLRTEVLGRSFEVAAGGFWQVHVEAPRLLAEAVLDVLDPRPGESALDLYAGVGLFACLLGDRVGAEGSVLAVEAGTRAGADAARNSADQPWVKVRTEPVTASIVGRHTVDLVVLDPPRAGAGLEVSRALAATRPRALAYVSCDPATFARDLAVFLGVGWSVTSLRAFDLFPQTEHVEIVCGLRPPS